MLFAGLVGIGILNWRRGGSQIRSRQKNIFKIYLEGIHHERF